MDLEGLRRVSEWIEYPEVIPHSLSSEQTNKHKKKSRFLSKLTHFTLAVNKQIETKGEYYSQKYPTHRYTTLPQ